MSEWKFIPGFPGYEVSIRGEVKSVDRVISKRGKGGSHYDHTRKGKILSPDKGKDGRFRVTLHSEGKKVRIFSHVLVLIAYVGERPNGFDGCHNDGDPTNNYLFNLRWDTRKSNQDDRWAHGTMIHGQAHYKAKLSDEQVREVYLSASPRKALAKHYGVSKSLIDMIKSRGTRRPATVQLIGERYAR